MTYPGNRNTRDPREIRNPDEVRDPRFHDELSEAAIPGAPERDFDDPATYDDPVIRDNPAVAARAYPPSSSAPRGMAGATIAVAIVLLAVIAFSFLGGSNSDDVAVVPAGDPVVATDPAPTASITPEAGAPAVSEPAAGEVLPPIEPNDPAEPVQTAPAQ